MERYDVQMSSVAIYWCLVYSVVLLFLNVLDFLDTAQICYMFSQSDVLSCIDI